jgi:hypothetical protein
MAAMVTQGSHLWCVYACTHILWAAACRRYYSQHHPVRAPESQPPHSGQQAHLQEEGEWAVPVGDVVGLVARLLLVHQLLDDPA